MFVSASVDCLTVTTFSSGNGPIWFQKMRQPFTETLFTMRQEITGSSVTLNSHINTKIRLLRSIRSYLSLCYFNSTATAHHEPKQFAIPTRSHSMIQSGVTHTHTYTHTGLHADTCKNICPNTKIGPESMHLHPIVHTYTQVSGNDTHTQTKKEIERK